MKILFDHQIFNLQQRGGISRYFTEIYKGLEESGHLPDISILYHDNLFLQQLGLKDKNPFSKLKKFKGYKNTMEWINRTNSKNKLKHYEWDVFHPTYYFPYFLKNLQQKPLVITIHDMIHEKLHHQTSQFDKTVLNKNILANKANNIIAVSEHTKKDIIELYDINPEKIEVIHHGYSALSHQMKEINKIKSPYLLFVGERAGYKCFLPMLNSISTWLKDNNFQLIVVGGKQFSTEELAVIEKNNLSPSVQLLEMVNDDELLWLYKHAEAFIFPSLYEGFGLPILEAFAAECPVVLPEASCFPEVAGDAGFFYQSNIKDSLVISIESAVFNTQLKKEKIIAGLEQIKKFSWQQSVSKHINVYQDAISNRRY